MQALWSIPHLESLIPDITRKLQLPCSTLLSAQHIAALWTLCQTEASLQLSTSNACSLFDHQQRALLQWLDDTALLNKRGWPNALNYEMAGDLVQDLVASITEDLVAKPWRRARLIFAHAETLVPLLCLLRLFGSPGAVPLIGSEGALKGLQSVGQGRDVRHLSSRGPFALRGRSTTLEMMGRCDVHGLVLPPQPPAEREWVGSAIAPFSSHVMFVVYAAEDGVSADGPLVRVVVNEQVVTLPGSGAAMDLPVGKLAELLGGTKPLHQVCSLDLGRDGG